MIRRLLLFIPVVALMIGVVLYFSDQLLDWFAKARQLDKDTLEKLKTWQDILSGVFGALGVFGLVVVQVVKFIKGKSSESENPVRTSPAPVRDLAALYYMALDEQCEFLRLDIIAKPLGERRLRLSLSDIYQDQRIRVPERPLPDQGRLAETKEAVPLMQALARLEGKRLVLRGKVGAGKTSFVNYLTHRIIQSRSQAETDLPPVMVNRPVVRLALRELGSRLQADPDSTRRGLIWREIKAVVEKLIANPIDAEDQPPLQKEEFERFCRGFQDQFKNQGVLLLDGLDEISEAGGRRQRVREAIEEFARTAPQTFVIVTGRPYAYETDAQKLEGFQQADLEPMTKTQIREFIRHWYLVARHPNGWSEQQAEARAHQLAEEIFARPYLPEMASTAMLLTLFIGLDYSDIRLPSSRAKLYEEAVELLLQRWTQNLKDYLQSLSEAEQHGMRVLERSREDLLKALKKLAYQTYLELEPAAGQSEMPLLEFSHAAVVGHLYGVLGSACDHEQLLYFLQYRSGLLVAGGEEDTFQFSHKSFHEYLAASHLLELPKWQETVERLLRNNLDWWREVFLLLTKKYSDGQYGSAVLFLHRYLLRSYSESDSDLYQQRLLLLTATAALELAVQDRVAEDVLYAQFHQFLQTQLANLLQSAALAVGERAEAGRLLSEVGDQRDGITVKKSDGHVIYRTRGKKRHALPDIDWQEIPAGTFRMGTEGDEGYLDEKPAHDVDLPRFFISRFPITNAQFRCFIEAGMYQDAAFWHKKLPESGSRWLGGEQTAEQLLETIDEQYREDYRNWLKGDRHRLQPRFWQHKQWNPDNHPVVGVSWFEALAYSIWLNEWAEDIAPKDDTADRVIRLPTEAEWEYAARGVSAPGKPGWRYAWGNQADPTLGNYADTRLNRTSTVGLFPPGEAFGLYDMSGNVWEWTLSRWGSKFHEPDLTYEKWKHQERERNLVEPVEFRIIRGGSWNLGSDAVRCAIRGRDHPDGRYNDFGFRVVCSGVLPGSES